MHPGEQGTLLLVGTLDAGQGTMRSIGDTDTEENGGDRLPGGSQC